MTTTSPTDERRRLGRELGRVQTLAPDFDWSLFWAGEGHLPELIGTATHPDADLQKAAQAIVGHQITQVFDDDSYRYLLGEGTTTHHQPLLFQVNAAVSASVPAGRLGQHAYQG